MVRSLSIWTQAVKRKKKRMDEGQEGERVRENKVRHMRRWKLKEAQKQKKENQMFDLCIWTLSHHIKSSLYHTHTLTHTHIHLV